MVALGVLVLVVIGIVAAVVAATRVGKAPVVRAGSAPVPEQLARWQEAGLLTGEQVEAIVAHEAWAHRSDQPPAPVSLTARTPRPAAGTDRPRRVPAVAEALGYLGGVLAAAGVVLLVARWWTDLGMAGRLTVTAFATLVLTVGGLALHDAGHEPAMARLQAFLWLLAGVAVGALAAVLVRDVVDTTAVETVVFGVAGTVTVHSGLLWWWRATRPVQETVATAGVLVTAGALMAVLVGGPLAIGLVVACVALVVGAVGLTRMTPLPFVPIAVGALGTMVGGLFVSNTWTGAGMLTALGASTACLVLSVLPAAPLPTQGERLALGVLGAATITMSLPGTLGWFSDQAAIVTGAVVALAGVVAIERGVRERVLLPHVAEIAGGLLVIGGVALTGRQSVALATVAGLAVSAGFVALAMTPGRVLLSLVGCLGLMVNVPWLIGWFFPGEGRVPLLILVAGALIVGVAVLLSRMAGRFRTELRHHGI